MGDHMQLKPGPRPAVASGSRSPRVDASWRLRMSSGLKPICPRETPCKCCGAPASLYGLVDFHKNCEIYRKNALEISGVPIYYHRCPVCRFIFTIALDHFTKEDFERYVYNEQYPLIDPDFEETRPRANAALVDRLFSEARPARILDYGGG